MKTALGELVAYQKDGVWHKYEEGVNLDEVEMVEFQEKMTVKEYEEKYGVIVWNKNKLNKDK